MPPPSSPAMSRCGAGRGPVVASALVMGSFAPDMTYFADSLIPGAMSFGEVTHSAWGVLTVDALTAAALVGLWLMVREPLVALLPRRWRGPVHGLLRGRPWRERRPGGAGGVVLPLGGRRCGHPRRVGPVHPSRPVGHAGATGAGRNGGRLPRLHVRAVRRFRTRPGGPRLVRVRGPAAGSAGCRRGGARRADARRGRWLAVGVLAGCTVAGVVHRCLRWYAYWGRIETPLDIIPTACFGAGAGLAVGLLLYGAGMRLRAGGPGPRA